MQRSLRTIALSALVALGPAALNAQQQVDIGLYRDGQQLEVRLRPTQDFNGIVSAVVFTLRWEQATHASLNALEQRNTAASYLPIAPSGTTHTVGDHLYQVFAGFGFEPLSATGSTWKAGEERTVATIHLVGDATVELVNDAWTAELANNADYYVSLDGLDRTGRIHRSVVYAAGDEPAADSGVGILPNPNDGRFALQVELADDTDLTVQCINSLGQVVYQDDAGTRSGLYRKDLDLRGLKPGAYQLRLTRNRTAENHSFIIQ
jgi:hypothetical protein